VALVLLWLPLLPSLPDAPLSSPETTWMNEVARRPAPEVGSHFARAVSRETWRAQHVPGVPPAQLGPGPRLATRVVSAGAALAGGLVFLFLARLVVGPAAALLAAMLLTVSMPWTDAATSSLPLMIGQTMALVGVIWMLQLQTRHREVGMASITAGQVGVAGVFLGLATLLAPAAFATFVAALLVWFLVALRRTTIDATTLPVAEPRPRAARCASMIQTSSRDRGLSS
jgi:hypothetical protein